MLKWDKDRVVKRLLVGAAGALFSLAVIFGLTYGACLLRRPAPTPQRRSHFVGIDYHRYARQFPRPMVFYVVTVDLRAPGIGFLATPQGFAADGKETTAQTVPGFLQEQGVQVAINGNYFYPMYVRSPFDYAPRVGAGVNLVGLAISNGDRYSPSEPGWPAMCIVGASEITFSGSGDCPPETTQALAGDELFVQGGKLAGAKSANSRKPFPRTAVALDKAGQTLWLVVVDGRQPGYSEGITLAELGQVLIELGADRALNFDGGGSTTLAIDHTGQPKVLNSPFHARVPTHLRPVANHLGIYADPLPANDAP